MSRQTFSIAYSGIDRSDDHSIDVEALAPALLAFGKLIRESNSEINGKNATAKVLVVSDFEHKCFNINFEVVLGYLEQIKTLLGDDPIATAKKILEMIGILKPETGAVAATAGVSYITYLTLKKGRKVAKTEVLDQTRSGLVKVHIEGDNNNPITVHNAVYNLSVNPRALKATRDAFTPIGQDGFDRVEFRDGGQLIDGITPDQTQAILASCLSGLNEAADNPPDVQTIPAWLSVYGPVFDAKAEKWRFRFGADTIYADITETGIAQSAIERGGSMVNDAYHVMLEIATPKDAMGRTGKQSYKIVDLIKFVPSDPKAQGSLFDADKK
ncbi:hypothetical protein [Methylosinus sp. PW1]|uniref:hypothetical protein n=1 Tax=Methylosinus sp. PW1 TaxID=107636 RepID=UPI0012EBDAE0|nr:hypothetical protein [Methylosinus sp. PW1]